MDTVDPIRIIGSFAIVIALIGLTAFLLRYVMQKNPAWLRPAIGGNRLQVVESRMLDAKRKLVLVKRDGQEHLLLLTPQGDLHLESVKDTA